MVSNLIFLVLVLCCIQEALSYHFTSNAVTSRRLHKNVLLRKNANVLQTTMSSLIPEVKKMDKENGVVRLSVTLSGEATQKAFSKACDLFNVEVKERGYKVPGFRPGSKLPPVYLYEIFGEEKLKSFCGSLLSEEIMDECEKTGMLFVGRGRIMQFNEDTYTAGKPHTIEIECDLWPDISYEGGYKGLVVKPSKVPFDTEKYEQVKGSIKERYKILSVMPDSYVSAVGDVVNVDMKGFERNSDGSKGAALPSVASGNNIEVMLEAGKFMAGFVEGLTGSKKGDKKVINVTFPPRPSGPGAVLSNKQAVFDVEVLSVKTKTLPEWNEELAARVREGLTLADMDKEVRAAIEGEVSNTAENSRNDALANELLSRVKISKLPESLVEENTQNRFRTMLMEFKEQGTTDEQLQEMASPEKYQKYKEICKANVEKVVKLGLVFRDITEKEKLYVEPAEVQEQFNLVELQAKQKGDKPPEAAGAMEEIENILIRKKVFDFLATHATITWIEDLEEKSLDQFKAPQA